jgi:hypothetical protein
MTSMPSGRFSLAAIFSRSVEIIRIFHIKNAVLQITLDKRIDFGQRLDVVVVCFPKRRHNVSAGEIDCFVDRRWPLERQRAVHRIDRAPFKSAAVKPVAVAEGQVLGLNGGRRLSKYGDQQCENAQKVFQTASEPGHG